MYLCMQAKTNSFTPSEFPKMKEKLIFSFIFIFPVVTGKQIIYFQKAKSLRRDPEKGIFYAHFKSHQHHRLDITPITSTALRSGQECAQQCAETNPCFSFNLASAPDVQDKLTCELLSSDIYNRSDKFAANLGFHHFSITVKTLYVPRFSCIITWFKPCFCCSAFFLGQTCFNKITVLRIFHAKRKMNQ